MFSFFKLSKKTVSSNIISHPRYCWKERNETMTGVRPFTNSTIGVGFGTAGLGHESYHAVTTALEAGFRKFDTAEADWWYDQEAVGRALSDFFRSLSDDVTCSSENLRISTKIPPWSLTSIEDIRSNAKHSREELLGFCNEEVWVNESGETTEALPFPLDVYYIHAPACWQGWHPRCDDPPPLLDLRTAWLGMEAVVQDHSAQRIGLSNVFPDELLNVIEFVQERKLAGQIDPPPRIPDAVQAFADPIKPAKELQRICQQYGIEFVSYSTLGTQHRGLQGNPVLTSPVVEKIARKHSRSTAEVVLSWARQHGMSVIPRSSKRHHILELARLLDGETFLDEQDMVQINSMENSV